MKLDDRPLLDIFAQRSERIEELKQALAMAVPLIKMEFEPFEKYCGKTEVSYSVSPITQLTVSWRWQAPDGTKLCFSATLRDRGKSWVMNGKQRSINLASVSEEALAKAFVELNVEKAEAAFEAVVLDEPWQIPTLLR